MSDDEAEGTMEYTSIKLPTALMNRVKACCDEKQCSFEEFLIDAINDRLSFVYKEKRKKRRM